MSGGWAEFRGCVRWVPGTTWVQVAFVWHPRYWRRAYWNRERYRGIVRDFGLGPFWLAIMPDRDRSQRRDALVPASSGRLSSAAESATTEEPR